MKLRKYSALVFGALASIMLVACSGGNGNVTQQTLTPMSTSSASVKLLTAETGATANLQSIAKGNGVYVAVGDGGAILTSTDGQKWSSVSAGVSINIHAITYNNTKKLFYAVGDNSIVLSSANGASWTRYQTLNPVKNLYSIMSVNGDLIIGAESSTIYEIDTNGRGSITVRGTVDSMKLISSTYGNGVMVLGSDDGSILYKSASNMGANWNRATKFSGMSINGLSFESTDGWFLAATSTGKVIQAESNMIWSTPLAISNSSINSVILDDKSNDFFAVGGSAGNSVMLISDDYNSWTPATLPVSKAQLNNVKCFDSNECFIVGDSGTILYGLQRGSDLLPTWGLVGGPDITAPTVTMSVPTNDAIGVAKSTMIQIKFSEAVKNVNASSVSLHLNSPTGIELMIDSIVGGANNTYLINSGAQLSDFTTYYVVIGNGITDLAGNSLLATNFSFTTGDSTAPTVVISTPTNNATGVSKSPNIQIQFSEAVTGVESNISLHEGSPTGASVAINNVTSVANSYTFSPSTVLSDSTTYYVVIGGGIVDLASNSLLATNFSFTTGDFTAPSVTMSSPTSNASNVSITPSIMLQFSETVKGVSPTNVSLHEGSPTGAYITLNTITQGNNNSYSFSPLTALKNLTTYYVVIESGVTDTSGNALVKSQFSFTTIVAGPLKYIYAIAPLGPSSATVGISYTQCPLNADGSLSACNIRTSVQQSVSPNPNGATVSNGYVYITNTGSNSYTVCKLDSANGNFVGCKNLIPPAPGALNAPYGIAINNGYAYITNRGNNSYTQCNVNSINGTLSSCNTTIPSALYLPFTLKLPNGIAINNGYAYITNLGDNSYTVCKLDSANGNFVGCKNLIPPAPGALNAPYGIAINNGYAYITNRGNNSYTQCNVNNTDGTLSSCKTYAPDGFYPPANIVINNGYAYIIYDGGSAFYQCPINTQSGALSTCKVVVGYSASGDRNFGTLTALVFN